MFSYLICGQINSRLKTDPLLYFQKLRSDLSDFEIIVSTWPNEISRNVYKYVDKIVISKDPGESQYGRNWERILVSTRKAISAASMQNIIRSRVEIAIKQPDLFKNLLFHNIHHFESKIFFPYRTSCYQYNKGLLFAWPDFFHIASKNMISRYWNSQAAPTQNSPFHMTTKSNNSLSSDQVLGANFTNSEYPVEYFDDKYYFSKKNWNSHYNIQNKYIVFFDENKFGLDFGRLARDSSFSRIVLNKILFLKSGKIFKNIYLINRFVKMRKRAYFLNKK